MLKSGSEWAFIARYVYTFEEFVFVTEVSTVQQNDSERTKNSDKKNKNKKIEQVNKEKQYSNWQLYVQVYNNEQLYVQVYCVQIEM